MLNTIESNDKAAADTAVGNSVGPSRTGGSIGQAFAIIRHLSKTGQRHGVTAIAKQLQISPSSCFNILKTLVAEDVVEFDLPTKTYEMGYGLLHAVRHSVGRNPILPVIAPGMRVVADKFSTAVGLWHLNRFDRPLLIWLAENEASTRIHLTIGQRLPALAGAVGRCVAAHRRPPPAEFSRFYSRLHLHKPLSQDDYLKEVQTAKECGFAVDSDCFVRGVTSVAVPILGAAGDLTYCLSATMFTGQHSPDNFPVIGDELRLLANRATLFTRGVDSG
jgi:IclR family acetate operon transcriptional repressor